MTAAPTSRERRARHRENVESTGGLHGAVLFGRARRVPEFLAGTVAVALLAWWAGEWLMSRPTSSGPIDRLPVALLAPLVVAVLVASTLIAADEELERTGARRWRRERLMHVLVLVTVGGAAVSVGALVPSTGYGAAELARNTLGCVGMVTLFTPFLGGRLAWTPAFGYVAIAYFVGPQPIESDTGWSMWPVQVSGSTSTWWVCAAWFVVGVTAYVWKGSRARRWNDA